MAKNWGWTLAKSQQGTEVQLYKELNPANMSLKLCPSPFEPSDEYNLTPWSHPTRHLGAEKGLSQAMPRFLTCRNYEIVNVCCFNSFCFKMICYTIAIDMENNGKPISSNICSKCVLVDSGELHIDPFAPLSIGAMATALAKCEVMLHSFHPELSAPLSFFSWVKSPLPEISEWCLI